jgi:hypothetical protein
MDKQTWTGLPEIEPIPTKRPADVEQAENMKALIGEPLWEALERREMNLNTAERIRDLLPSEWEPRHQLAAFFNPDASQLAKDAALETFEWPWKKTSFETLKKLDSLKPDFKKQEDAALKYQNEHKVEPATVTARATVTLPMLITITVIIALAICGAAIR